MFTGFVTKVIEPGQSKPLFTLMSSDRKYRHVSRGTFQETKALYLKLKGQKKAPSFNNRKAWEKLS